MISIQALFGKNEKFFDLLEASAVEARGSVSALVSLVEKSDSAGALEAMTERRRKLKKMKDEITRELCLTFVTPIEREDIEALANSLYKVPKGIEKFAEHFMASQQPLPRDFFLTQVRLLEKGTEVVQQMVRELRKRNQPERVRELNEQLQQLEGEADKHVVAQLKDLYSGRHDPLTVIILVDLSNLLEKAIDRCRDTGSIIFQVLLKYA
ncbi:MAG: DUF47 family protein [Verrucomicrobiota bacterium]|nr:DUF47 family protein [Verrucomicrobiota bacterium]